MAVRSSARSILARPVTGYCGRDAVDLGVDLVAVRDDRRDQLAGQSRPPSRSRSDLGEVALQDGVGRALTEVGLEDRGQRESTSRPSSALPVSLRHHRR